ncbi:MAG: T9SS type A sorting domain-containing protein, partial [Flavobacteriales bacterium]
IETSVNLIEIEDVVIGGYWLDYMNYSGSGLNGIIGLDYTITPASQLVNHPYAIEGVLRNSGSADQLSTLKYEVYGATGSYSGTSTPTTVNAYSATNTIDSSVVAANPLLSPAIGVYGVSIWGESDSAGVITTISDTVFRGIEISEYIYAKDYGENNSGSYILGGVEDQNHISTRYEMYADELLIGLRAYISDRSHVGAEVKAVLYELDSTATEPIFLAESDNYILTAQDLGNWVDIPFDGGVDLYSGWAYEFGIAGFVHPTDSAYVGTSGMSLYNGEHSLFDELGLSTQSAGTPTWYYITATPMVRMNFDPGSANAISDMNQTIFTTYPNPTNGIFTIKLGEVANYDVTVNNVLGQTVFSNTTKGMNTIIDLSSFDKGIYTVELKDENAIYTEKIIVE